MIDVSDTTAPVGKVIACWILLTAATSLFNVVNFNTSSLFFGSSIVSPGAFVLNNANSLAPLSLSTWILAYPLLFVFVTTDLVVFSGEIGLPFLSITWDVIVVCELRPVLYLSNL